MVKIISFINMKGGVGKTTVTVNLARELASNHNKKVLLVDMDPQFNATQLCFTRFSDIANYTPLRTAHLTIFGLLSSSDSFASDVNITTASTIFPLDKNLDIIPGDLKLTDFETSPRGSEKLLKIRLKEISDHYDYIFIDTPATYSVYSQTSLIASDYYAVPMMPDMFAALGYSLLQNKMKSDPIISDLDLNNLGIIVNLWSDKLAGRQKVLDDLEGEIFFKSKISEKEINRTGTGALMSDRTLNATEIKSLANEFIKKTSEEKANE